MIFPWALIHCFIQIARDRVWWLFALCFFIQALFMVFNVTVAWDLYHKLIKYKNKSAQLEPLESGKSANDTLNQQNMPDYVEHVDELGENAENNYD